MADRVLVVAPSSYSIGELANAIVLARQLDDRRVTFLTSATYAGHARASGFEAQEIPRGWRAAGFVREAVRDPQIDAVLLADHHLTSLERIFFRLSDALEAAPLIALDSLCFGPAPRRLELAIARDCLGEEMHRWFPPVVTTEQVPEGVPLLRPVPVARAGEGGTAFDLYGDSDLLKVRHGRTAVRQRLGIPTDHTVILAAISHWASQALTQPHLAQLNQGHDRYLTLRLEWIAEMARRLDRPATIVVVTSQELQLSTHGVEIRTLAPMALQEFTDLLGAVDLYLCDNLVSGAMARAVLLGTPVITLTHEAGVWDDDSFCHAWRQEMSELVGGFDFPYLVHPFGWISELEPLIAGNPYLQAVPRVPAFSLLAQVAACANALESTERPVLDAIRGQLAGLPSAPEAFEQALRHTRTHRTSRRTAQPPLDPRST